MLKDKITLSMRAGNGGRGSQAMNLEFATGGDGGYGGSVYMVGDENVYDLNSFDDRRVYKADRGEDGAKRRRTGSDGKDLVLTVPLTTEVHYNNRVPIKITKHNERVKVLPGGRGGCGSITMIKHPDEEMNIEGEVTAAMEVTLVLKLQSDIIFIGYPNAGKSSLLNVWSDASAKVADYAFTTLEPQIGMCRGVKLMDLPGLIEGTYAGKGLGTEFVKHTESSKLVAHFVSYENKDMLAIYKALRKELEAIDPKLFAKPEVIILTKADEVDAKTIAATEKLFAKIGPKVMSISILDDAAVDKAKELLLAELAKSTFKQYP